MGYWVGYNRRDTRKTYLLGKKTHSYKIRSFFSGRFYGKYVVDEDEYRKKKGDSLAAMEEVVEHVNKYSIQRDFFIKVLKDNMGTAKKVFDSQKESKYPLSYTRIMEVVSKQA